MTHTVSLAFLAACTLYAGATFGAFLAATIKYWNWEAHSGK